MPIFAVMPLARLLLERALVVLLKCIGLLEDSINPVEKVKEIYSKWRHFTCL